MYKQAITHLYSNHLLTSWDMQVVEGVVVCKYPAEIQPTSLHRKSWVEAWENLDIKDG